MIDCSSNTNALNSIISGLEKAPRLGEDEDIPEGARYILMSDTLCNEIIEALRAVKLGVR